MWSVVCEASKTAFRVFRTQGSELFGQWKKCFNVQYSGTPLNGHPSINITDKFLGPNCFQLTSMQPLHNGHPTIMDKTCDSKLSALEGFHCSPVGWSLRLFSHMKEGPVSISAAFRILFNGKLCSSYDLSLCLSSYICIRHLKRFYEGTVPGR